MPHWAKNTIRTITRIIGVFDYSIRKNKIKSISNIKTENAYNFCNNFYKYNPTTKLLNLNNSAKNFVDLSIIIPVYNVEKYIKECITSILNQKTKYSFDIVIVDDNSQDNSLSIINSIKDERIKKVMHLEKNCGGAYARNIAMYYTDGKYIMFVDSDDYIMPDAIEKLMDAAIETDADVTHGQYVNIFDDSDKKYKADKYKCCTFENNFKKLLSYPGFPCMKVFKREILNNTALLEHNVYDDTSVWFLIFPKIKKFTCIKNTVYCYRYNQNGLTSINKNSVKAMDALWSVMESIELIKNNGLPITEEIYYVSLIQLSKYIMQRNKYNGKEVLENEFIVACDILDKLRKQLQEQLSGKYNNIYKLIDKSFKEKDFGSWCYLSCLVQ